MNSPNYVLIQLGFALTTVVAYSILMLNIKGAISRCMWPDSRKKRVFTLLLLTLISWVTVVSALSIEGFFQNFSGFPPRLMIVLIVPLVGVLSFSFSRTATEILSTLPPKKVIRLQFFRVFVELLLWSLYLQALLPVQMTFDGRNFDVLAGLSAPFISYFCFTRSQWPVWVAILWNFIALGLLINIVSIAILSIPSPFRYFMNEPANTIVAHFPIVWLPALLVPLAYTLHIFSLRQLLGKRD
jgi:hypothetical protein